MTIQGAPGYTKDIPMSNTQPTIGGFWNDAGILVADGPVLSVQVGTVVDALAVASQDKLVYSTINHGSSIYVRNTNCWIPADKTCWAVWNSLTGSQSTSCAAISPRHVLLAQHTAHTPGDTFRFVTNTNTVVTRTLTSILNVGTDIQIGLLNTDLPGTISFAKTFNEKYLSYIDLPLPIICGDQESKLLVRDWTSYAAGTITHANSTAAIRLPLTETITGGDSGSPVFLLLNNELVLLGSHFGSTSFEAISDQYLAINTAMTTLGGGYQLTIVDLTPYALKMPRIAIGHSHALKTINGQSIEGSGDLTISTSGTIKADGTVPFTGDQSLGTHKLTNLAVPTAGSNDAAREVDVTIGLGQLYNNPTLVRVASFSNISVSSAPAAIDGVTLAASDLILLTSQTNPVENALYLYVAAGSALTRIGTWSNYLGLYVVATAGNNNHGRHYFCTAQAGGTIGVDPLNWARTYVPSAGATTDILVGAGILLPPVWATATGTGAPVRAISPTFTGTLNAAAITASGTITSTSSTGGIGYATGAGGTVTQISSRTTGVTINKVSGAITLVSAAGSATAASFTVTNSTIAATDIVHVTQQAGTDKYIIAVTNTANGSFQITSYTTGGTTTEQPVFNFVVIKAMTS
jgi:hypothetical protein